MTILSNLLGQDLADNLPSVALLFGCTLLISALGFYRVVYFISIGYTFAITAMAVITPILFYKQLTWVSVLQNGLLLLWGLRLGIYLIRREMRKSYRQQIKNTQQATSEVKGGRKALVWLVVSILYVLMFSPSLFNLISPPTNATWISNITQAAGLLIMCGGLLVESFADKQKSAFKTLFPKKFCSIGLYQWVRYPNYLGEIIFWVGSWVAALSAYNSVAQWISGLIGTIAIVLIMMGSTKRLEASQGERYGNMPEYQEYIRSVPVLYPYVPLYTLKHIRVYLE